jgi:hypothetical protein
VRREDLTRSFEGDPLLKVGAGAMLLALGFAIVVAVAAYLDRPMESAAAKPEVKSATEPARSLRPRRRSVGREGHTFAQVPGNTRTSPPIGVRYTARS